MVTSESKNTITTKVVYTLYPRVCTVSGAVKDTSTHSSGDLGPDKNIRRGVH